MRKNDDEMAKLVEKIVVTATPLLADLLRDCLMQSAPEFIRLGTDRSSAVIAEAARILGAGAQAQAPREVVVSRRKPRRGKGYTNAVRRALAELGRQKGGANADALLDHIEHRQGLVGVTLQQVRSALKQLTADGEALRLTRGRYLAGRLLMLATAKEAA